MEHMVPSQDGHLATDATDQGESPAPVPMREQIKELFSIDRKLIWYKLFYLTFLGGIGCVLPYVAVFLKQNGLSPEHIGIISGLRPIIGFMSAPLLGTLGDRYGWRKCLLLFSIVAWLAIYVAFYHVPSPPRHVSCAGHRYNNDTGTPEQLEKLREDLHWIYAPGGLHMVFWITFALIVGGEVFQSPTTALSDAGTLQTLGTARLDEYGAQRAWGAVGWGISSFMAGAVVSSSRQQEVICGVELYFSDYRLLTYVFIGFLVLAFVAATQIKFKEGKDEEQLELTGKAKSIIPTPSPAKDHSARAVIRIFLNVHYGSWLATSFFVGICNGLIWGFLYWHLDNLGADQMLLGVAGTVLCLSEFVMFFLVGKVIKVFGHMGIMYLGLFGYTIRFCVYAVITNPWWVLPAEMLQGVTFSCVWVSMTAYTTMAVPSGSLATVQGILHGVYFGLGSGSGHLIGGLMIGYFGAVITFFGFAAAAIVVLIMFAVAQKCSVKPDIDFNYKDLDNETETGNHTPDPESTASTAATPAEDTTQH